MKEKNKRKQYNLVAAVLIVMIIAIAAGVIYIIEKNENVKSVTEGKDTVQNDQNAIYDELFDSNNKVTIKVDISDKELEKLQEDYKLDGTNADTYRIAEKVTFIINSEKYIMNEVGIKLKGNTSVVEPLVNGEIDSRNLVNFKISFKQTFDDTEVYGADAKKWSEEDKKERKNRTFAGLESIELKWNRNLDATYTCNYWANQMFRDILGYGQNTTLCNVNLGEYNYGIYTLYESVDENFIKRYFKDDEGGDLYKCGWSGMGANYTDKSIKLIGVENANVKYTYDLKTNKKTSENASLKKLITTVNESSDAEDFSDVVDVDKWVKYAAVAYFAGNPDDFRNNYNNHYVYFLNNGKAVFIPYDYDRCFGIIRGMNRANGMTEASPVSDEALGLKAEQLNPLFTNSITGISSNYDNNFSNEYKVQLDAVLNSKWMDYKEFEKAFLVFKNNYEDSAIPSENVRAYVNDKFEPSNSGIYEKETLSFAESGNNNMAVKEYFEKIIQTYKASLIE